MISGDSSAPVLRQWARARADRSQPRERSMTALLVVGTGPGVGTTVACDAVAARALARGARCAVVQPAETGPADPLSCAAPTRRSGRPAIDPTGVVDAVLSGQRDGGLVVVDGSGGLLIRYDDDGFTPAELARTLRLPVVVVAGAGPGTVNATALTLEALAHRGLELLGVVVGCWPDAPGPVERSAVDDLEMLAARPLLGALPAGLGTGRADGTTLLHAARRGLGPALGGSFDAAAFRRDAAR